MFTFVKAQAASLIASGIDFLVTILAVELLGLWYLTGTVIGTVSGGLIHFSLGRVWVFNASDKTIPTQFLKYFVVWSGSLLLNATGVYVVTHHGGVSYILSKIFVSILVAIFYNYIIQKKYVFR